MRTPTSPFDDLLSAASLQGLHDALERCDQDLSLPQAFTLAKHAATLMPDAPELKLAVVHTYTSDLLDPWFELAASLVGLKLRTYHAPYGLSLGEAQPGSKLVAHAPDVTLLMLQRTDLHPDLARPTVGLSADERAALRDRCVDWLKQVVGTFRAQPLGQLVVTLLPSPSSAALGLFDAQSDASEQRFWSELKADLAAWLRSACPATTLLDLDEVLSQVGRRNFFDRRYWYSARYPFSAAAGREFARRVVGMGKVLKSPRAKVLVLDADNTLWGGVVGEDGPDGIALGPDYPGNAFVDFQRRVLDFQQRGLILAMCSKNNPTDVDPILADHPHQVLRDGHFAARRVNWLPKPDNLISLAEELNLGLDSFVFVDDSDHECAAVRARLPMVEVIQVPKRPSDIPACLDRVSRLEILSLTSEDLSKTQMYAQERQRREMGESLARQGGSAHDYLARLGMKMRVEVAPEAHVVRLSQLSNKTNQFNLTTRRYDEQQMRRMVTGDEWLVADFSLADVFGDSGIVGLAIWRLLPGQVAELDTFLMSCRVIGRQAESAFMECLLGLLAARGVTAVMADYLPTAKNELVREFLPQQAFSLGADRRYHRSLVEHPPRPATAFPIDVLVVTPELSPQAS